MSELVRIQLQPAGSEVLAEGGTPLAEALAPHGVEFPCGGRGRCRRCRIRVLAGWLPVTAEDRAAFSEAELTSGWRLACHARAKGPLTLEIAQWDGAILADDSAFEFTPREGLGIAVDLGTTTLVAQLLDLASGRVLAVRSALNPQAAWGADVMSRVEVALDPWGAEKLRSVVREAIGGLIAGLLGEARGRVAQVVVAGNAVMHHLFSGISVEPFSRAPFEPSHDGRQTFAAPELGWQIAGDPPVDFLPCLGGFVGSDVLAGILATRVAEGGALAGLVDLGTNGEIVFGSRDRLVCASAAAGPAFEGGRVSVGMRASAGAISEVRIEQGSLVCRTLGGGVPCGICGSGLVDAVAAGLEMGAILPGGRLAGSARAFPLAPGIALTQQDIRELQLAKAAVAAGIRIVLKRLGASPDDVNAVYLAGAFGNYISRESARRIGLIDFPDDKVHPAGNTALLGAKLALFAPDPDHSRLRAIAEHISLASDPEFQDIYVGEMPFPSPQRG
jgi:uncharacterized 2Fe-2S/4Fe-4S cluster protein (DUF4445 family)